MILKKYRILVLLVLFIILINFSFEYKSHAEVIALSAGLVLFLKACAAVGVTYIAAKEVSRVTEDSIKLYNEWQKFIKNKRPNDKPPVDWEKTAFLTLLGLQMSDTFMKLVDSVKDFFKELGAKEGKNSYGNVLDYYETSSTSLLVDKYYKLSPGNSITFNLNGNFFQVYCTARSTTNPSPRLNYRTNSDFAESVAGIGLRTTGDYNFYIHSISISGSDFSINSRIFLNSGSSDSSRVLSFDPLNSGGFYPPDDSDSIFYYFEPSSYQFTDDPDDIKPVYPNLNNLPGDKLLTVTDNNGKTSTYYKGSIDDLYNDWQKSQSAGNVFGTKPVNAVQTDNGIKIEDNTDSLPYPEIPTEPGPQIDTPTALGQIIILLKQLVNWSSNIFNEIKGLPEMLFKPTTSQKLNTDKLKKSHDLSLKFPFSIPWDIARVIRLFGKSPSQPDFNINIDNEYIKINYDLNLDIIDLPVRFFRYVATAFFIFFLASKTHDLIKW